MKGIHLIFIFSIISQTFLFSQIVVKRNNQVSKEQANVNWSKEYTLFDYTTDEPIFPLIRNGQPVYKIYYASKEDPRPNYGEFSIAQVEGLKYYKFKNRETCFKFCLANKLNAVPTLTTSSISGITTTTATSGGIITADGGASITARGVVWSTSTNPTIALTTKTSNGTGTGSFTSSLTNLTPKTTYYVRAYATNSVGTAYGNEITLTTTDSSSVMGIPCPGIPTVKDIDGYTYNTVQIGTQCWTKENLRVTKYRDGSIIPLDESGGTTGGGTGQTWSSRTTGARTVYGHNAANLATYGYLYNWYAVADTKGLCPSGWHVPSDAEWTNLTTYLGGESVAGGKMKSTGTTNWNSPNTGASNESGFTALPTGFRNSIGFFIDNRSSASFWSSTESDILNAWYRDLYYNNINVFRGLNIDYGIKSSSASVRCLKDTFSIVSIPSLSTTEISSITATSSTSGGIITSDGGASITARGVVWSISTNPTITLSTKTSNGTGTGSFSSSLTNLTPKTTYYVRAYATNSAGTGYGNEITFTTSDSSNVMGIPCPGTPTVKDIDGNTYNTVQIGSQCWTKENLRVTKYRDGTVIPLDESGGSIGNGTSQTWSSRTTGARTVYGRSATNLATYGYLYNWYAVADTKGLCPSGWHVPSDSEWTTLTTYLGGESVAGGKMKSTGTTLWSSPNTEATNESGFSVLPGGYRVIDASFNNIRFNAFFWSATLNFNKPENRFLSFNFGFVNRYYSHNESVGASVRCLMDTSAIVSIPTITTTAITSITTTSATSGGNITADGGASITGRGVVWSTSTNPTIALSTKTSTGTGTGSFTSTLTNLTPKTTYYVRAYATNSAGTGYGNEITFTTTDSSIVMGIPCTGTPTVKDTDGNTYNTVQVGTQCWTKENLRVTKYRDGTLIPLDESGGTAGGGTGQTWSSRTTGARTVYGHSASNFAIYGYLYNWYAVVDTKGLCPSGWHVPTDAEWTTLTTYLGGESVAGGKMKSTGTTIWNNSNIGATNQSGFSGLPGGFRNDGDTDYYNIGRGAFFWSATESSRDGFAWARDLFDGNVLVTRIGDNGVDKNMGLSVRCLKDSNSIVSIPSLTTTAISAITTTTATSGGNITADGGASITARGVVWSTSTNPTITLTTKTSNGTGTGSFSSTLTNLTPKTTYYVRAYATNSAGTGYGNEISFTTAEAVMNIPCPGLPTVEDIDGNIYNTVKIGTQCWMKENLRVTKYKDGTPIPMVNDRDNWLSLNNGAWCWYNNDSISFNINHGKLYNWYAAANKLGICPNGWHLGTLNDWNNLINFLEGEKLATIKLKENSGIWWNDNFTFYEDLSGFSALPSGQRTSENFYGITYRASFMLPEEIDNRLSRKITLRSIFEVYRDTWGKEHGASIRCIKDTLPINVNSVPKLTTLTLYSDTTLSIGNGGGKILSDGGAQIIQKGIVWSETKNPTIDLPTKTMDGIGSSNFTSKILNIVPKTKYYVRAYAINREGVGYGDEILFLNDYTSTIGLPCLNYSTVQDIDGNVYNTVQIGTQCWMKENLRVTKYNYGIEIPLDTSGGYWGNEPRQTWTNRKTGARTFFNNDLNNLNKFGYLYNAYVTNSNGGNICPIGWHVPSDGDWSILTRFLGGEEFAGNKLKIYGSGTNESGFSGLAGGFRESSGNYRLLDAYSYFLSSSKHDWTSPQSSNRIIYAYGSFVFRLADKSDGLSIRCIKD